MEAGGSPATSPYRISKRDFGVSPIPAWMTGKRVLPAQQRMICWHGGGIFALRFPGCAACAAQIDVASHHSFMWLPPCFTWLLGIQTALGDATSQLYFTPLHFTSLYFVPTTLHSQCASLQLNFHLVTLFKFQHFCKNTWSKQQSEALSI